MLLQPTARVNGLLEKRSPSALAQPGEERSSGGSMPLASSVSLPGTVATTLWLFILCVLLFTSLGEKQYVRHLDLG